MTKEEHLKHQPRSRESIRRGSRSSKKKKQGSKEKHIQDHLKKQGAALDKKKR